MDKRQRSGYRSHVRDEEWALVAPYLALCREDSAQREYPLRAVFKGLRYMVRTGSPWRYMPNDLAPGRLVYQQRQGGIRAPCFETMGEDLRMLLREFSGPKAQPRAMLLDRRTLQSTPQCGARAGYDGAKPRKGSKVHAAVDTLGHLRAWPVTPANEPDRAQVGERAGQVQQSTAEQVAWAYVDPGYTAEAAQDAAAAHGIPLAVVPHNQARRGFMLLPRRWVAERSFAWAARFRRLARDYERLATTLSAFPFLAFACFSIANLFRLLA